MSLNKSVTELTELNNLKCINSLYKAYYNIIQKSMDVPRRSEEDNYKLKLKCEAYKKISK